MYYKQRDDVILCVRSDDGTMTQFLPSTASAPNDDSLEWIYADKHIIRLPDFSAFVFADDPHLLESMKQSKLAELGAAFDERVAGTIDAHDYQMQFDISDALKMQGAIQLLETTGTSEGYLTLGNDETVYHVPLDVMKAVLVDMLSAYAACHARKQELRAQINAAQTIEDLDAIKITWPL